MYFRTFFSSVENLIRCIDITNFNFLKYRIGFDQFNSKQKQIKLSFIFINLNWQQTVEKGNKLHNFITSDKTIHLKKQKHHIADDPGMDFKLTSVWSSILKKVIFHLKDSFGHWCEKDEMRFPLWKRRRIEVWKKGVYFIQPFTEITCLDIVLFI